MRLSRATKLIPGIAATLLVLRMAHRTGRIGEGMLLSRRTLMKLGGLAMGMIATGSWKGRAGDAAATGAGLSPDLSCILSPEQTEGPYYIPREKVRSTITEGRAGAPLKLRLTVVDAATCKPIKGAAVDIWHCDAGGIYSGFMSASRGGPPGGSSGPTDKRTFLRGIQVTNSKGLAQFHSLYPGWYRGRTVHIHVKVHLHNDVVNHVVHTGQLFFSDTLTSRVYQATPYKSRAAARDTFNATDSIYQSGGKQSTLAVKHDGRGGYVASITLGVHRS